MSLINLNLVGLSIAGTPDPTPPYISAGTKLPWAWSNCDFSQSTPTGTDVVTLIQQLLMSQTGDGTNGAFDVFEFGVGLGLPQGRINLASFTNVRNSCDWDTAAQLFFAFPEPLAAKDFFDKELCKPFGLYLSVNNQGQITLNRPKHPQKFYIGGTNQVFPLNAPSGIGPFLPVVPIGVYTGPTLAAALQAGLNGVGQIQTFGGLTGTGAPIPNNWTVSYNTNTHKFNIQNSAVSFDILANTSGNPTGNLSWNTLGFTSAHGPVGAGAPGISSDIPVGGFGAPIPLSGGGTWTPGAFTLSQNDVWDIQEVENQDAQITRVIYEYDYDWDREQYSQQKMILDAEAVNLGDVLGAHDYVISSKGMVSGGLPLGPYVPNWAWWVPAGQLNTNPGGCGLQQVLPVNPPISSFAVDADTWAQLYALMLLDRYKYPPLRFKCKVKLGGGLDTSSKSAGTRIEVGDAVRFTYNIASVVADRELDAATMSNRVFEVIAKTDNWKSGFVELELMGYTGNIGY